ncbi:hemerythrin domain-containing protein [Nocardia veterana]|uniref:Hemerythrin domain-containing protein n=1 Tax=Nocardia veterana TaxID=132249 RepID=A0A7X6M3H6_9NOCA|nr:hemerythrin domain-containing protein [Nocardia veterana]NKY89576.1 hemerythrin domain-containing protein [Nocardia veterana]
MTDHERTDTADPEQHEHSPRSPRPAMNRRAMLLGGAGIGGLVVGAGLTVGAQHALASQPAAPVVPATEELMTDHGLLKRILLIYRNCGHRLTTGDHLDPALLFHSAQMVHSYIEDFHEGIEEGYVFPRLLRAGKLPDTIRTLLTQHDVGRKLTIAIIRSTTTMDMPGMGSAPGFATADSRSDLARTLDRFITMYEPHEAREDTIVFPAFREVTADGRTFDEISEQIAHAQQQRFGDHGVSNYLDQIADIERQLGIYDLAAFTPPAPE